jgi:hypothetical protein
MRADPSPFPLTYDECRARFRRAGRSAAARLETHPVEARGPEGQALSVDVARLGEEEAERVIVILSGTHSVEGFAGSVIQTELLVDAAEEPTLPEGAAVVLVHAVNPYGMAWWRRQNESNVDLNRNWVDFDGSLPTNAGYPELHPWLCPDVLDEASEEDFRKASQRFIEERGYAWVKEAVTIGQYALPGRPETRVGRGRERSREAGPQPPVSWLPRDRQAECRSRHLAVRPGIEGACEKNCSVSAPTLLTACPSAAHAGRKTTGP